ncbi:MAG: ABC transporter substrate-binding protein [Bacillota bacterium]|jgi:spermidine/putrescine transport system substrate-binding protein
MKKMKFGLAVLLLAAVSFSLFGCGMAGLKDEEVLNIYNWGEYMDPEVLDDFTAETGIEIKYEEFTTNEDMYTKLRSGIGKYDIIIPSDYMIERMIKEDMLYEIDFAEVPNIVNIDENLLNLSYDPEQKYSVPFTWGTVGIVYNTDYIDVPEEEVGWDMLFDEKYKKQILMSDSVRDSVGVALEYLGYSQNSRSPQELAEAEELLIKQKPLVLAYVVDEVRDLMLAEEATLALVWSGEGVLLEDESDNLKYVLPRSGSNLWVDAMVIPKTSQNKDYAQQFINYVCREDISARICDYIGYATPSKAARKYLDEDLINNFNAYPDAEFIENKTEMFNDPSDFLEEYDRIWTEIFSS